MTKTKSHSEWEKICKNLNQALKDEMDVGAELLIELKEAHKRIKILEYAVEHLERKLDGYDSI